MINPQQTIEKEGWDVARENNHRADRMLRFASTESRFEVRHVEFEKGEYTFISDGEVRLIFNFNRMLSVFTGGSEKIALDGKAHVEIISEFDGGNDIYAVRIHENQGAV